ncbi:MAG: hypothetical protein SFY66_00140 [Oculatellaceae cyanobacterium bins.114]|nr:hypothetical protein [Oculatellaceae cyanobacterium bins.114]
MGTAHFKLFGTIHSPNNLVEIEGRSLLNPRGDRFLIGQLLMIDFSLDLSTTVSHFN